MSLRALFDVLDEDDAAFLSLLALLVAGYFVAARFLRRRFP